MASSRPPQMPSFVEVLEARIAPAIIINVGAPAEITLNEGTFNYDYAPPGKANPFEAVDPATPGYYFVDLGTARGDALVSQIRLYGGGQDPFTPWITIAGSGEARAFFQDNGDGRVSSEELVGIAYGQNLSLTVAGSVRGDIVGNFAGGAVSDTLQAPGRAPSIVSLAIGGSVDGSIIGAGNFNRVSVTGSVTAITTASDGLLTYNLGGGPVLLAAFAPASGIAGGSINNVTVAQAVLIQAGNGGAGGAGGSIFNLDVTDDFDGIQVLAGHGGPGSTRGGVGGSVTDAIIYGMADLTSPVGPVPSVKMFAGDGGSSAGTAGSGGTISKIYVGYEPIGKVVTPSPFAPSLEVQLVGGKGGNGVVGGAGGRVDSVFVSVKTMDIGGTLRDEIVVAGGAGGDGTTRNGAGGAVNNVTAQNLYFNLANPSLDVDSLYIKGGDAGGGSGVGAAGGGVTNVRLMADLVKIHGGKGSDSLTTGGAGGAVTNATLLFTESERVQALDVLAGAGGASANGRGGAGGSVASLAASLTDFSSTPFGLSKIHSGAGGDGVTGGVGGTLINVRIFEPAKSLDAGDIEFRGGQGGDGSTAGGAGGRINALTFIGWATSPSVFAGAGGDALNGRAGIGGALSSISLKSEITVGTLQAVAGNGGSSLGASGAGGAGGALSSVNVQGSSAVLLRGGTGGSGVLSVGAGGSIISGASVSTKLSSGPVAIEAGHAGVASGPSTRAAAGGFLRSVVAVGSADITIAAGNGSAGGAGGSIANAGWYRGVFDNMGALAGVAAPEGAVSVRAGSGSALGGASGAGGSISGAAGFSSGDATKTTIIAAGDGSGAGGGIGSRPTAGGSVTNVLLYGGQSAVEIFAGHGGSAVASAGGAGGSVSRVSAAEGVNFQAIAAGDGGTGTRGGQGGSVSQVNVFGDIGKRSGADFGIDTMGGIFAGEGGSGTTPGRAGSVTNVTAAAISSIVAGRPTAATAADFSLVTLADRIFLRGLAAPTTDRIDTANLGTGAFTSVTAPAQPPSLGFPNGKPATVDFSIANLVGAVKEPFVPGANVFKTKLGPVASPETPWILGTTAPVDGLVAAVTFGPNKNFRPQALLTVAPGPAGSFVLQDYRNDYTVNS
jgi:hypothetical protein